MIDKLTIRPERECDFDEIRSVVLGSPEYYSLSGYLTAAQFGISAPFEVQPEFYMVFPFKREVPRGAVRYSQAFGL